MGHRQGLLFGVGAYGLWGVLPLYFPLLRPAGAVEILAHRVLWSAVLCLLLVVAMRRARRLLIGSRAYFVLAGAAALVAVNWGTYVYAVNSANVAQAAFGYYINPLMTVFLGVVVLRERLRPLQWAAVAVGMLAVATMAVAFGRPPWIALTLATTFATYGLVKKSIGRGVDALSGLTVETTVLAPFAVLVLVSLQARGQGSLWNHSAAGPAPLGVETAHLLAMAAAGIITVTPLVLFAAAARRIPLSMLGLLQYIAPTMQFLIGVAVQGERMSQGRWVAFGFVWVAVCLLGMDTIRSLWGTRRRTGLGTGLPGAGHET
ncbi:MAG: protein RarD [Micrococcales bacterium]|nr:MAG: protein RarD [Micrococcales bacterium]PIE25838.1 MAG: protein RarD [Micrococcales bacterium]